MGGSNQESVTPIEIKVENISQLFNTLDPFPFSERDLDKQAEEYIVGWARELPRHHTIRIIIHLPSSELAQHDPKTVALALRRYFDYRVGVVSRDLREMFRIGRIAALIGLVALGLCLTASQILTGRLMETPLDRFLQESLVIVGWVANWKPLEIFLYDWWPLARRRNLYRRLAQASVDLKSDDHNVRSN
jgi:hypothetical protein